MKLVARPARMVVFYLKIGGRRSFSLGMRSTFSFGTMSFHFFTAKEAHESIMCSHMSEGPEFRRTQTEPEITRVPCRRRTKNVIHHAVKFVDPITAFHNPQRRGKSRDTHRYSVIVQELATEWTQSYQCKTKSLEEKKKNDEKLAKVPRVER